MFAHFSSVQSLSHVWLFVTPWTAARQASLSITNSQSLLRLMSIESVMPSNHLILRCPFSSCLQSFAASGSFSIILYWKVFTPVCLCIFGCFYTTTVVVTKTVKLTKPKIFTEQENSVYSSRRKILENRKEMVGNELKEVEEECEEYCVHMTTVRITLWSCA